jgi:hypothetical protein
MIAKLRKAILIMDNRCCCDLLLQLALSDIGRENGNMVEALAEQVANAQSADRSRGLDVRARSFPGAPRANGRIFCSALAAAVAVLYSVKNDEDAADGQDDLMDWFSSCFGGYDCASIAASHNMTRDELCPKLILSTYLRLREYIDPDNHLSQKTLI